MEIAGHPSARIDPLSILSTMDSMASSFHLLHVSPVFLG
jgi:hypothetical protein